MFSNVPNVTYFKSDQCNKTTLSSSQTNYKGTFAVVSRNDQENELTKSSITKFSQQL